MIKVLMMMLLMIFSASCQNIRPLILCDNDIDSRCRCRCYSINNMKTVRKELCSDHWDRFYLYNENLFTPFERDELVPVEHPINLDIRSCDKISGFRIEDVAQEIIPWGRRIKDERD